jgi:hypothetical protein
METVLGLINLYRATGCQSYITLAVKSHDCYEFNVSSSSHSLTFRDENLVSDDEGRLIINLLPLKLKDQCGNVDLPTSYELPKEVMEARKKQRRLNELAANTIDIVVYKGKRLYFYLESDELTVRMFDFDEKGELNAEKPNGEVTVDKIDIVNGRRAIAIERLDLGHPFLKLPDNTADAFEAKLKEKETNSLHLESIGINSLTGLEAFKFTPEAPQYRLDYVKLYLEYFNDFNGYRGYITEDPIKVSLLLGIPIVRNN